MAANRMTCGAPSRSRTSVRRQVVMCCPLWGLEVEDFASALDDIRILGATPFRVRFTPSAAGLREAILSIASNDPDENPFQLLITGKGLHATSRRGAFQRISRLPNAVCPGVGCSGRWYEFQFHIAESGRRGTSSSADAPACWWEAPTPGTSP